MYDLKKEFSQDVVLCISGIGLQCLAKGNLNGQVLVLVEVGSTFALLHVGLRSNTREILKCIEPIFDTEAHRLDI